MNKAGEIVDGKGSYQIRKLRRAVAHCRSLRTAVDVGAHVGTWAMQLVKRFQTVVAFEPVAAHRECFGKNVTRPTVVLHACALGESDDMIQIATAPTSSGDSYVDGSGDIPMRRLDDFNLTDVDFIKIDTEGFELPILRGGVDTIARWMPVVIVEQKPGHAQRFGLPEIGAVPFLQAMGYRLAEELSGDYIMVPL